MEDNDLFYADILNDLLSILGQTWWITSEVFNDQKYFFLKYGGLIFCSGKGYYKLLCKFVEFSNSKEFKNVIPDFLKVSSIEELCVQIDLHYKYVNKIKPF